MQTHVMNSQTGFRPANAAPTAKPANPDSVIGVSITYFAYTSLTIDVSSLKIHRAAHTRFGPNLSSNPIAIA